METLVRELRQALRSLARRPTTTLVIVATLALGIGANTAIFSVVNAAVLRPLAFSDPDRLVRVWPEGALPRQGLVILQGVTQVYETVAGYGYTSRMTLTGHDKPLRLDVVGVTPEFFHTLGVQAAAGRLLRPGDEKPDQAPSVVISYGLWQDRFGGDPALVGQAVQLDGLPRVVVGVAARSFRFPGREIQAWTPIRLDESDPGLAWGGPASVRVVGRLRPGLSAGAAQRELIGLIPRIRDGYPWPMADNYGANANVKPLRTDLLGDFEARLVVLSGAVALVLLIACVNVANLLLARARSRSKEIALRAALGGRREQILRRLLVESCLLGVIGGLVGLAVAFAGLRLLTPLLPADLPRIDDIAIDGRVLGFSLGLSLLCGLVFGLLPAWRTSRPDLHDALREGGRLGGGQAGQRRLSRLLVGVEVALSVVVAVGAALLVQTFWNLSRQDLGFRTEQLYVANLAPSPTRFPDAESRRQLYAQLLERLEASGQVRAAAVATAAPFSDAVFGSAFLIEGRPDPQGADWPFAEAHVIVSPSHVRTLGLQVVSGRGFEATDRGDAPEVVLVNRVLAKKYWSHEEVVGRRIAFPGRTLRWMTIVGVVSDARYDAGKAPPTLYQPLAQASPGPMWLLTRSTSGLGELAPRLRGLIDQLDPELAISRLQPIEQAVSSSLSKPRFTAVLLGTFALLALLLGAVGVYGITVSAVAQQSREMAIRMALGADRCEVLWRVLAQTGRPVLLGVSAGIAASLLLGRLVTGLLHGVSPTDPLSLLAACGVLVVVATLASLGPARRATRTPLAQTLRTE